VTGSSLENCAYSQKIIQPMGKRKLNSRHHQRSVNEKPFFGFKSHRSYWDSKKNQEELSKSYTLLEALPIIESSHLWLILMSLFLIL
jgi:hypothetical protein